MFGRTRLNIQYHINWNAWVRLSNRIIVDVRIVWKDSFNYTIQCLLECLDVFVLYANSGCGGRLDGFV